MFLTSVTVSLHWDSASGGLWVSDSNLRFLANANCCDSTSSLSCRARFEADLADTQEGRDIYELVKRGDVDQMSFAFRVIRQRWNDDRSRRVLTEVSLADGDVSVVTYPAYPTTTVEAREHIKHALKALKEGRQIDDATMMVLQTVFDDMSEGHEYIMKALGVFETLMNDRAYDDDEEDKIENDAENNSATTESSSEPVEEAGRKISLRLAKAIVNSTK